MNCKTGVFNISVALSELVVHTSVVADSTFDSEVVAVLIAVIALKCFLRFSALINLLLNSLTMYLHTIYERMSRFMSSIVIFYCFSTFLYYLATMRCFKYKSFAWYAYRIAPSENTRFDRRTLVPKKNVRTYKSFQLISRPARAFLTNSNEWQIA